MAVSTALTILEIVAITISVIFVLIQLLIRSVEEGRLQEAAPDVFLSLLYATLVLIGATLAAGIHAVQQVPIELIFAIGAVMMAITLIGYASIEAFAEISDQIGVGLFKDLQDWGSEDTSGADDDK